MLVGMITNIGNHISSAVIAQRFHNSAAAIILKIAPHYNVSQILFTGDVFKIPC
ncbi:MAG: hydrogenase maturation protein HypF [Psychromonas sp.]|jgi:hydrogenase maturation protein HypF